MRAFSRRNVRARALGSVTFVSLFALACAGSSPSSMLGPSPIIIPDAATLTVGTAQVFSVQYATVERFDVFADHANWSDCVTIDATLAQTNSIRVIGRRACPGYVFVRATIKVDRSPVVAALKVE